MTTGKMATRKPDVTFVMAAFNAADTIEGAIASALAQRHVEVEVVVVDDRSSDDTRRVVENIEDERVRLVCLPRNRGPAGARNAGLDAARGTWIAILDADDSVHPDRLCTLIERAEAADAQVVVDNIEVVSLDGQRQQMFAQDQLERQPFMTLAQFIESNVLFRSTYNFGYMKPVFEKRFLDENGLRFNETLRIGEDYILLASALALGARCAVEPRTGYTYNVRAGSISRILELHHVEAMMAGDADFVRDHSLDDAARKMQKLRSRSLGEARSFLTLVGQIKARKPFAVIRTALAHPRALRHLRMPVMARLRRLAASAKSIGGAPPARRFQQGESPIVRKGQ